MSKIARAGRFDYLPKADAVQPTQAKGATSSSVPGELRSVPRGDGRMEQQRDQLNVRVPTTLKRQAVARAALEGKSIGELVEELLYAYIKADERV